MHLKWEVDSQWPESQAANDSHDVIEERKQGCHDSGEAHEGGTPDKGQQTQPEYAATPEWNVHPRMKESAPRKLVVNSTLNKRKKGLGNDLQGAARQ